MKRVITLNENEVNKIVKNIIYKIDNNLLTEALANPSVIQDLYIKISLLKPPSLKVVIQKTSVVVYGYSKGQFLTFFDNGRVRFHDGKSYFKGGGKWDYTMVKNNKLSGGWLKNASYKNVSLYDGLNNAYKNFGTSTTPDRVGMITDYGDPKTWIIDPKRDWKKWSEEEWKKASSENSANAKLECVPYAFRHAVKTLKNKSVDLTDKLLLKTALAIVGRESSFGVSNRYKYLNPLKTLWAKIGGDTSVGYGQIKPDKAKEYGMSINELNSALGALTAVYKIISDNYIKAKKMGYTTTKSPGTVKGTGNAALDISILAFNAGGSKILRYCATNNPDIKRPCTDSGKLVEQYDFESAMNLAYNFGKNTVNSAIDLGKNVVNTVKKAGSQTIDAVSSAVGLKKPAGTKYRVSNTYVQNYIPNFKTKRWDNVEISSHGYIEEVASRIKKYTCF